MTDVPPDVVMNGILGKITDNLINGDGQLVQKNPNHFVAFMNPGIPFASDTFNYALEGFGGVLRQNVQKDSNGATDVASSAGPPGPQAAAIPAALAADMRQKSARAESFYALCDLVPDPTGIIDSGRINAWSPTTRVSHVYALALQFSQVVDVQPDTATTEKITRWRSLLQKTVKKKDVVDPTIEWDVVEPSDLVKAYNSKMDAYIDACLEYLEAFNSARAGQDPIAISRFMVMGHTLRNKVKRAASDWATNGYKDDYDRIAAAIASVQGRSMPLLKQNYKDDFEKCLLTSPSSGANFLYTAPTIADFARGDSGWTKFYFNKGSFDSNHSFSSTNTNLHGGFGIGPFSLDVHGNVGKTSWNGQIDIDTFNLTFEMCRVPIYRPWLNLAFLSSAWWRFDQNNPVYANSIVSDGQRPSQGLLPAITTDCIFIRNLRADMGTYNSHYSGERNTVSGGGGVSYGPFHLGGSHVNKNDTSTYGDKWDNQGISFDGMQCIGFACYMMNKAPNPDPQITNWI